jgi:hypothetical protein
LQFTAIVSAAELDQLFAMWGGSLDARVTREQFAAGLQVWLVRVVFA